MRLIVSGHREQKLINYNYRWISTSIISLTGIMMRDSGVSLAYSGMASGIDLMFCQACLSQGLAYIACIPFEEQENTMSEISSIERSKLIKSAKEVKMVKNSWMVENCDCAIVVFDGNKGGTANVFQQLIEKKKPFYWINPVWEKIWKCY